MSALLTNPKRASAMVSTKAGSRMAQHGTAALHMGVAGETEGKRIPDAQVSERIACYGTGCRQYVGLLAILLFGWNLLAQDLYVTFDDVAAGTTDASINMGTISKTNGTAVSFSWSGSAGKVSVENGGVNMGLLRPVTVAGISYTNHSPTKHLLVKSDNTVSTPQQFTWGFVSSRKVSFGFSITISNFTGLGSFYTIGGVKDGSKYNVLSLVNDSPPYMQNEGLDSPYGENINVPNNLAIWVTGIWDSANATANNRSRMYFYNLTNMALIGFSIYPDTILNDTVNTFQWGINDAHTKDAGTTYRLGCAILYTNGGVFPVWPGGSNLHVPTNFTPTAVTAAHAAASDGDTILLPATNATWTSGVTISKNNLKIAGVADGLGGRPTKGTNNTVILADGAMTAFTVSGNLNTITNLQITGDGANDEATGIVHSGAHNRYGHLYLHDLEIAFYMQDNSGLLHNSTILDCDFTARNIPGDAAYDAGFPLANNSTNQMVYEDCVMDWGSGKNVTGASRLMSSQQGQAFMLRHCTIFLDKSGADPAPMIDYHGDWDPGSDPAFRPGLLLQIYKNTFVIGASSISGQKFVDVRGGISLIYSNTVTGAQYDSGKGIAYREEHPEDSSPYTVTNSYHWQNFDNTGSHAMAVSDDGNVIAGRNFTNAPPAVLVQLAYPHPMRGSGAQVPTPTVPASIGIGRSSVRIVAP